jgi:hypothetical protein
MFTVIPSWQGCDSFVTPLVPRSQQKCINASSSMPCSQLVWGQHNYKLDRVQLQFLTIAKCSNSNIRHDRNTFYSTKVVVYAMKPLASDTAY